MFGRRPDGRRIKLKDPIVGFTPYLMPQRVDAQVNTVVNIDCDVLTRYIKEQRDKGNTITYMDLVIAAYVRAVSQYPELNRFIMNKQVYARNSICASLTMLRESATGEPDETTIKQHFSPYDTVYDIHDKFQGEIEKNRKVDAQNGTDKIVHMITAIPGLVTLIVGLVRLLDRYGLLPRFIINVSPFHTGLFIANMASIGMPHVNHHIYNFGTTSLFIGMGSVLRQLAKKPSGDIGYDRKIPLGIVSDERITSGAEYGRAITCFFRHIQEPSLLETPPETVRYNIDPDMLPNLLTRRQRRKQRREGEKTAVEA